MLDGYKTHIAATGACLLAVGATLQSYVNGQTINWEIPISALIALAMIFLRKGIKKQA